MDCRLQKNHNKNRCKVLRNIKGKRKTQLSWKQAKAKYPHLTPWGNADKDMHVNKKDCRPFNKNKHMVTVTEGDIKTIYATPNEYLAYKKISYGRKMGLPPIETHKELKADKLSSDEMRAGLTLYEMSKGGAKIEVGEGNSGISSEAKARFDPWKMQQWLDKLEMEGHPNR
jgi:hypothetical protein